jgi:hypothetical protein
VGKGSDCSSSVGSMLMRIPLIDQLCDFVGRALPAK